VDRNAFQNAGTGLAQLTCVGGGSVPRFTTSSAAAPPEACANGATAATTGDIALLSSDLRFPQFARASLAYDRRLGHAWVASVEGMYTRAMSTFFYTNWRSRGRRGPTETVAWFMAPSRRAASRILRS
jgi:hypothetical protein